ncbi:IS1595 family transposase [Flavobacterium amniphilum]|uniref:IS1595 family transposase n=1 Tax=Flavobacterium amniphilum TaxID=1834035 RepID=UPI002029F40B|nr:IS1595 family transposase [Flavobacterium amniphilum]MCL9805702.1 IS1595 family transposase [Flavobacterium amniphilum]
MAAIKFDFTSCYEYYDSQFEYEDFVPERESTFLSETCEDILRVIFKNTCAEKVSKTKVVQFPDPVKLLTTIRKGVSKTLPVTPKFIIFNKSIMAKHPNIELNTTSIFKSKSDMTKTLNTEKACREHLEKLRWDGKPICPHCGSQRENHYKINTRGEFRGRYKCKDCRLPFSVTVGTIFEKSQIPLQKWFEAIFYFVLGKKGVSSVELHRAIGVTQKSAWFMLSRIRNSVGNRMDFEFDDITQVDETYVGGKNKNRSKHKKVANTQGRSGETKTVVFGMLSQGLVHTKVIKNAEKDTLQPIIKSKVKKGSVLVSDGWSGYSGLNRDYDHKIIKHSHGIFKKGPYHTNGIEGFWSLLKRGIIGVYHYVSPKHLYLYCDEFSYRYNIRKLSLGEQFNLTLINSDERLTYRDLISDW